MILPLSEIGVLFALSMSSFGTFSQSLVSQEPLIRHVFKELAKNNFLCLPTNTRGQLTRSWGDMPYPRQLVYDGYGDLIELHTFQAGSGWTGSSWPADTGTTNKTQWKINSGTGLLTSKIDAVGQTVSYLYHTNNFLKQKTWMRGGNSKITYWYTEFGDLSITDYVTLFTY